VTAPAPTVVYDNTTNDNRNSVATGPDGAAGSQVTFSGTARVVTDFLFGYVVDNDATATVALRQQLTHAINQYQAKSSG